ncbi:beta-galactosidase/beta-glucuronidase [Caulobacter sp. AP07]|uniref:glycosyl hydrolase 2 galactose-binding domain-containing protein n=1 Tax=Caulobacter sp. AP07 TaxID=1144304 RepID=UPI000271F2E5|nr:LamG-like jellyroll fold domain-containing protein [Caulobacter sp. AP07]EJL27803.1 beta-galactosidase/beta-glucuronidase [Caulobacter sp. AP07]
MTTFARRISRLSLLASCALLLTAQAHAQTSSVYGPYNADLPRGGDGLTRPLAGPSPTPLPAEGPWTLQGWVKVAASTIGRVVVAGVGDTTAGGRFLVLDDGAPAVTAGGSVVKGQGALKPGVWRHLAAVSDGSRVSLYLDGAKVGEGPTGAVGAATAVQLGPRKLAGTAPFGGQIAGFTVEGRALSAAALKALAAAKPDPDLTVFETGSPSWPVQVRQMYGQVAPQEAWTRPKSKAPVSRPVAVAPYAGPALRPAPEFGGDQAWIVASWSLAEAPKVTAEKTALSKPGFDTRTWYRATVPGTVLTTLVDRGVYPDPDYALNNTAIPESLNKQDYWYRAEFDAPGGQEGRHQQLIFKGINYAAEIWLNGEKLGELKGAFIRGQFDVTGKLKPGARNAIAVRVSPPPHPGIAHEESLTAGVGENGGMQALDGPTFIASEGWDWIPSVRDRNTGLWQDVVLRSTGPVRIGDSHVVTTLPKPDNSVAEVEITVPVENLTGSPVQATVRAAFDAVAVEKVVTLAPGAGEVRFALAEFPQLSIQNPKLWWPNGYGQPALHELRLSALVDGTASDRQDSRFGIRQMTYELSLMESDGDLRRVEVDFSKARQLGQDVTDGSHEGVRKVTDGWATSLTPEGETSPAVRDVPDTGLTPYLVLKVNGVKIAAKGGNWGTDDWRKRVSRERLEPYFRLHRDAHLNTIRNWVGQNTEDVFFDLADEYGLLVLNDFWASTQDYQLEPQDVPLFLKNAADVIARYRNHPSIALWFGRNEGVPQPILNEGLEKLVHDLDGTRWYTGSSNRVNLQGSGPYNYREPETYYTEHAKGFSVEVGTPSFPTLEAFEAAVPAPDRWPISDVWAYHDWHPTGNGATKSFIDAMTAKLGAPTSLEDFERKAQLMNYETHRAIFEGMNAELWTKSSGRLLWMTQPAWPSTMWQILSHDYDTHASYYGTAKGSEIVHVQMNFPDHRLELVNNGAAAITGATLRARVLGLDGQPLAERSSRIDAAANSVAQGEVLDLAGPLADQGAVIVRLDLAAADGTPLSSNLYWLARDAAGSRKLSAMTAQPVSIAASAARAGDETVVTVSLANTGAAPALNGKLTLVDGEGQRILPAYYADNYVSLLPGERRTVEIRYPAGPVVGAKVALRGWNVTPAVAPVR